MKRLLVVDDNEENLYLLRVLLESQGHRVELARNGAEALDKARGEPPDLVISDILMPVMDGFTLCRNWRADERLGHIPFIFYTATYTDPKDERLALDLGADAFITKPADPEAFMAVVQDVVGRAETGRLVSPPVAEGEGILKQYSEVLVRKLEEKSLKLEKANETLEREIAERRRAEEAWRESHDLLTNLARLVPGVIYQYRLYSDGRSAFPYASPGIIDIYEVTPEEVREDATPVFGRLHPEDTDHVTERIQHSARTLETFVCEFRVILPRQGLRWRWSQAQPERTADGGTLWHGIISDTTDRVEAEEALRERDEQLRQSQKMEAVGQLAGGIAHDFNNLLAAILGYSDLLLADEELADSAREDIKQIRHAADRASVLTRQILAFSRRQALRPEVVSLNDVLAGTESLLRHTLGEHIDLVSRREPGLGLVEADVHQFEQVIMNLAINARDAMVSGGQLILETANVELDEEYCRAHHEVTPGSYVMLVVSDNGMGMDEVTLERIFEPFFTTKALGEGTGLGLATVYGIVKQSHGAISVESKPGQGASFKILLPRVRGRVREEIPATEGVGSVGGEETILIVEDEAPLRSLIVRVLGGLGYRVFAAGTAAEALEVVKEVEPALDLLLTDVVLPGGVQGNELARDLSSARPDLSVLYVSGYPRDAIVHAGQLDAGINFLEKPFTPQTLAHTVRRVLDKA